MRLGEQHFLTSKSPEILQMIVNHNISLYTILPPAKNHLLPSDERGLLTKVHGGAIAKSGIPIEFTDRLILGISDVHPQQGLTCPDRKEAMIKRCMIERARKRIVLADSYKLNTAEAYHVASLGDIDYLVTEDNKTEYIRENWPAYSYKVL